MVRWKLDVEKVLVGLGVTTVATQQPIMEAMMQQGPKLAFRGSIRVLINIDFKAAMMAAAEADRLAVGGSTANRDNVRAAGPAALISVNILEQALGMVVIDLLPRKILTKVKRSMRRDM